MLCTIGRCDVKPRAVCVVKLGGCGVKLGCWGVKLGVERLSCCPACQTWHNEHVTRRELCTVPQVCMHVAVGFQ